MDPKTKRILLSVIAILVLLKFVIQPLWNWQTDLQQKTATIKRQAVRTNEVLKQQDSLSTELERAQASLESLDNVFPRPPSVDALKLRVQQQISKIATQNDIEVDLVSWGTQLPSNVDSVVKQQLRIELAGATKALTLFHTELLSSFANFQQIDAELSFRGSLLKSKVGQLTMNIEVYHWLPIAEAS